MRLRDVELGDVEAYVQMRCDPVMMGELGGPLPREGIEDKVKRDVESVAGGNWIKMILMQQDTREVVAGCVLIWPHEQDGERISEIGWMVLPRFQGRGVGKTAVRALLDRARDEEMWGLIHAFPGVTNAPSNGICRSLGFRLLGQCETDFADRVLQTNHWVVDPAAPRV
ncbi:MAG TPA: GNAT family N-acetyltransferase [Actinocrinis sp.]|nr:GNAT family N-acetyltransferase [Actinocrinis sp.]